jgi:hypothetical protein
MSKTTHVTARSFSGQHAIDGWESEGGAVANGSRAFTSARTDRGRANSLASGLSADQMQGYIRQQDDISVVPSADRDDQSAPTQVGR